MGVRLVTLGATELRLASPVLKRDFRNAVTIGGATGQIAGGYLAAWVTVPSGFTGNSLFVLFGADTNRDGIHNQTDQSGLVLGGPTTADPMKLKFRWRYSSANITGENLPAITPGTTYLVMMGVTNIGTNASPVWQLWLTYCAAGGTPQTQVAANATALTNSATMAMLSNIFAAATAAGTRTPVGFEIEHVAYINGDFPWDTANNPTAGVTGVGRPHHSAIGALAGVGADLFTYETLAAAQNAGTLPGGWTNLRSNGDTPARPGRADVSFWYKLANTSDLVNWGNGGARTLVYEDFNSLSGGIGNAVSQPIAPAHWATGPVAPSIIDPLEKFIGGGGARSNIVLGTYDQVNTTALERRWIYGTAPVNAGATAGAVVPGFDWADITGFSAGMWSRADTLPFGGPYTLQVRDKNATALATESTGWDCGTKALIHGQSSADQINVGEAGDADLGTNRLGLVVDATARGRVLRYTNAGTNTGYTGAVPSINTGLMAAGGTPSVGQGSVAMLNEWNRHNPRHPLLIATVAIGGTAMSEWANNDVAYAGSVGTGHPSWRFMGAFGAVPGTSSGNNSGVMEFMAQRLGRHVDVHVLMWTPGISQVATGAGSRALYVSETDTRFSASASAPWLIFPLWRVAREPTEASGTPTRRQNHLDMITELGARGIRGPYWNDILMVAGIGHSAYTNGDNVVAGQPGDQHWEGQTKLGLGIGRALAWVYNRRVKANGPRVIAAWTDNNCATVNIELGRACRTLNGRALSQRDFWVSLNNGVQWFRGPNVAGDPTQDAAYIPAVAFTVALSADGTRAILTPADGGAAWNTARLANNLRVDYGWAQPFHRDETSNSEITARNLLHGILYDNQEHRGTINVTGPDAGNPLQGTSTNGAGSGVAVAARGAAKLVTTERFTGSRTVTVRLMSPDGLTVLREKAVSITAS